MGRVILDCLPIPDPGAEARVIVRRGMLDILAQLHGTPNYPPPLDKDAGRVDILITEGRDVVFVSPDQARSDAIRVQIHAEMRASLDVLAWGGRAVRSLGGSGA